MKWFNQHQVACSGIWWTFKQHWWWGFNYSTEPLKQANSVLLWNMYLYSICVDETQFLPNLQTSKFKNVICKTAENILFHLINVFPAGFIIPLKGLISLSIGWANFLTHFVKSSNRCQCAILGRLQHQPWKGREASSSDQGNTSSATSKMWTLGATWDYCEQCKPSTGVVWTHIQIVKFEYYTLHYCPNVI